MTATQGIRGALMLFSLTFFSYFYLFSINADKPHVPMVFISIAAVSAYIAHMTMLQPKNKTKVRLLYLVVWAISMGLASTSGQL